MRVLMRRLTRMLMRRSMRRLMRIRHWESSIVVSNVGLKTWF